MKLRTLRKMINRKRDYIHVPQYTTKFKAREDSIFIYYSCGRLRARYCKITDELFYLLRNKKIRKRRFKTNFG